MDSSPNFNPIPQVGGANEHPDNKRSTGRIACELVRSSVGKVLDVSRTGLRVRSRKKAGKIDDIVIFQVTGANGQTALKAKVVWTEKRGFRNHETGLELVDMSERQRREMRTALYGGNPDAPGCSGKVKRVI